MRVLVTGGAGFIGANYIHYLFKTYGDDLTVLNVDLLTYAGNLENLQALDQNPRYTFLKADICDKAAMTPLFESGIDRVVHFAAESHVDRSIHDATPFVLTNVLGTQVLLDLSLKYNVDRFVHVSTDEVYGSLGETGVFTEDTPLAPNSPYSASKASSDLLVRSYVETHGLNAVITRCSNNYGPYQFPEKLIPLMITNALEEKALPVYGKGINVRDWIYVEDHCRGVDEVAKLGKPGEVYNLGGEAERQNIEIVKALLNRLEKPESLITYVTDRPGHDFRYAMGIEKAREDLGWAPQVTFEEGLDRTVRWYLENETWWRRIKSGDYQSYYEQHYGQKSEER